MFNLAANPINRYEVGGVRIVRPTQLHESATTPNLKDTKPWKKSG
ncbi:MAG: hypothetical protein P4L96_14045 [Rhodoferax sp.]|nr:hypothetical protein [Rhodoferax sp.]